MSIKWYIKYKLKTVIIHTKYSIKYLLTDVLNTVINMN